MSAPNIPGHRFVKLVDEGGFASVYEYVRESLGKAVAIKVLRPADGGLTAEEFRAEAMIMARLSGHPNIVTIHDHGTLDDGRPYLVMEYCPPPNLKVRAERERLSTRFVAEVGIAIAGAVETAHRANVLHRDIKPANILIDEYGAKLTDFGISELLGSNQRAGDGLSVPWAPLEALLGHAVDHRSDVYSLAATIYTLFTGRWPYEVPGEENELEDLIPRMRIGVPQAIARGDVPAPLEDVVRRSLHPDMTRRHASALEFALDLKSTLPAEWALPTPPVPEETARAAAALTMSTRRAAVPSLPLLPAQPRLAPFSPDRDQPTAPDVTGTILRSRATITTDSVDDLTRARPIVTEQPPAGTSRRAGLIGAVVTLALGVGAVAALSLSGDEADAGQGATAQPTIAFDPAPLEAGQPKPGGWTRSGTSATVTWQSPDDARPGDEFQWQHTTAVGQAVSKAVTTQATQATITGLGGGDEVCARVWVVRAGVPSSRQLKTCTTDPS